MYEDIVNNVKLEVEGTNVLMTRTQMQKVPLDQIYKHYEDVMQNKQQLLQQKEKVKKAIEENHLQKELDRIESSIKNYEENIQPEFDENLKELFAEMLSTMRLDIKAAKQRQHYGQKKDMEKMLARNKILSDLITDKWLEQFGIEDIDSPVVQKLKKEFDKL